VTTTSAQTGRFEARFFHLIFEEEFARVRGHFGPINTLAFHPDGKRFVYICKTNLFLFILYLILAMQVAVKMVLYEYIILIMIISIMNFKKNNKILSFFVIADCYLSNKIISLI